MNKKDLQQRVVKSVLNNDFKVLAKIRDNKEIIEKVTKKNDKKISKDILDLSSLTCYVVDDIDGKKVEREYSLLGLAIKNNNLSILNALHYLGCDPLKPAYTENGKEVSVLSYLKEKNTELTNRLLKVGDNFEQVALFGEMLSSVYHNNALSIETDKLLEKMQDYDKGEIDDKNLYETLFFYKYNIYECDFEFKANAKIGKKEELKSYYPVEYLLMNRKEDLIPETKVHKLTDKTLIPCHGVDKEALINDLTKLGYVIKTETLGKNLIDKDGAYNIDTVLKSVEQYNKYRRGIEAQIPKMDWARKDYGDR